MLSSLRRINFFSFAFVMYYTFVHNGVSIYENAGFASAGLRLESSLIEMCYFLYYDFFLLASVLFCLLYGAVFYSSMDPFDRREAAVEITELLMGIVFCALLFYLFLIFYSYYSFLKFPERYVLLMAGYLRIDYFALFSKAVVSIAAYFALQCLRAHIYNTKVMVPFELPVLMGFGIFFLQFVVMCYDFFFLFLLMEALAFVTIFLNVMTFSKASVEAAIKYFVLNALSAGLFLFGVIFIYSACLSTNFFVVRELADVTVSLYGLKSALTLPVLMGGVLIFLGLFFKLGAYPFHTYVPDTYEASSSVTIVFLAVLNKISFFLLMLRILFNVFHSAVDFFSLVFMIAAVSCAVIGCAGAIVQSNLKRLFGYASINQLGFILGGLACGSYGGLKVSLLYVFLYLVSSIPFLFLLTHVYNIASGRAIESVPELTHVFRLENNQAAGILGPGFSFSLSVLSMAGLPPLLGFFAKYFLFLEIFKTNYYALFIVLALASVVSSFYYLVMFITSISSLGVSESGRPLEYFLFSGEEETENEYGEHTMAPSWAIIGFLAGIIFYAPLLFYAVTIFSSVDRLLLSLVS